MKTLLLFLLLTVSVFAQGAGQVAVFGAGIQSGGSGTFSNITDTSLTQPRVVFVGTGGLLVDDADFTFDGVGLTSAGYKASVTTLTYAASTDIAMTRNLNTVALTGNVTFTTSDKAAGQYVTVRVVCDGTNRTLAFPGTWVWVGSTPPTLIVASKVGVLSLICFGSADSDVVASWVVSL